VQRQTIAQHAGGGNIERIHGGQVDPRRVRTRAEVEFRGHQGELVEAAGFGIFCRRLCELAAAACSKVVHGKLTVEVVLFDFEGRTLGR